MKIYLRTARIQTHTYVVALIFVVAYACGTIQACFSWIHEHACRNARIRWTVGILHASFRLFAPLPFRFGRLKCSVSNDLKIPLVISGTSAFLSFICSSIWQVLPECNNGSAKRFPLPKHMYITSYTGNHCGSCTKEV